MSKRSNTKFENCFLQETEKYCEKNNIDRKELYNDDLYRIEINTIRKMLSDKTKKNKKIYNSKEIGKAINKVDDKYYNDYCGENAKYNFGRETAFEMYKESLTEVKKIKRNETILRILIALGIITAASITGKEAVEKLSSAKESTQTSREDGKVSKEERIEKTTKDIKNVEDFKKINGDDKYYVASKLLKEYKDDKDNPLYIEAKNCLINNFDNIDSMCLYTLKSKLAKVYDCNASQITITYDGSIPDGNQVIISDDEKEIKRYQNFSLGDANNYISTIGENQYLDNYLTKSFSESEIIKKANSLLDLNSKLENIEFKTGMLGTLKEEKISKEDSKDIKVSTKNDSIASLKVNYKGYTYSYDKDEKGNKGDISNLNQHQNESTKENDDREI